MLLTVPGNTQMIFNTYLRHSATAFQGSEGQRYSVARIYGPADHYWEEVRSYTNLASVDHFREFIGSISAGQRELFRFPPAGHSYYNGETLVALEDPCGYVSLMATDALRQLKPPSAGEAVTDLVMAQRWDSSLYEERPW